MRTTTIALAAGAALALSTIGGVAVAVPALQAATTATATEEGTGAPDDAEAAERVSDRVARITEELAGLVTDGTITQDQADAVATTLAESVPADRGGQGPMGEGLAAAASTLGLEQDALRERLKAGETLGEVADAEGVDRADLVSALVAEAETALAERVGAGDLTQERADEISAGLADRITAGLDRSGPGGGSGMRGGHGPGGGGHADSGAAGGDA